MIRKPNSVDVASFEKNIKHFSYVKKILFDFENILANINNNQSYVTNSDLKHDDKMKTKKSLLL